MKTDYNSLIAESKNLKNQARLMKERQHDIFHEKAMILYKKHIHLFDIAIILAVLFNVSALVLTNILVVKTTLDVNKSLVFTEANPAAAERFDFEYNKESLKFFVAVILYMFLWGGLLIGYYIIRLGIASKKDVIILGCLALFLLLALGFDFFNDFSYWVAIQIFG